MTELIWDGKYKDGKKQGPVRIALPFQTIETVNESVQERQRSLELFAQGRETEWRNRLIWGDKKYVLPSLLPEFAGKVNLIYIDPPFDTGADFSFTATIPRHSKTPEDGTTTFTKEPSILEQKAYRDTWGRGLDSYLQWFYETAVLLNELLNENGSLYVHFDWHVGHYSKTILDEVFGQDRFVNEVIWKRTSARSGATKWGNIHDTILLYAKSEEPAWNAIYQRYDAEYLESKYKYSDARGVYRLDNLTAPGATAGDSSKPWRGHDPAKLGRHWAIPVEVLESVLGDEDPAKLTSAQKLEILWKNGFIQLPRKSDGTGFPQFRRYLGKGTPIQDVITDLPPVNSQASERLGYDTQKPEALLERVIKASSNEGDLVLDCFVGSGTTAVVAEKLNRRWIACDLGRFAIHTTRKRLLGIPNVRPFVVQNLGKYERQAWQAAEFDAAMIRSHVGTVREPPLQNEREMAYRKFILDLYHATPVSGHTWLHGAKGGRMVHVGAVDAPVTLADVKAIAKETWKAVAGGKDSPTKAAVDILGWEFALELNETAKQVAAESRVSVAFKKIPHEALDKKAVEQGDIKFFELGALSVEPKVKKLELTLTLSDFVIPIDDIPEEVRKAIKHWSQMVDYWAVDWDYKDDTFHNQWQSYRTRKDPKIELEAKYKYSEPGKYTVVVKVIDILGNDTTKTLELSVK